jgi:hypothetical protein
MMSFLRQQLVIGGLHTLRTALRLLLLVLFPPCVGAIAVICAAQACCQLIVDKEYRKGLSEFVFGKPVL